MNILIKNLHIENFKGIKNFDIKFNDITNINGQNASGKTSIFDSVTWLLYNKDSLGSEKFSLRPLDINGNPIHFIEICVSAVFSFDGEEYELKKIQKEKWVKKRGYESQEYAGNINEYEINGYPKSEKEYKSFISNYIQEENFKLITNPMAFVSLPWKEQRKFLFSMVPYLTDYDIAKDDTRFSLIANELNIASIDDIRAKYTKSLSVLKKQQDEIPTRIDEVSKQIENVDISDLELKRNAIIEDISLIKKEMDDIEKENQEYSKKMDLIFNLKLDISKIENEANKVNVDKFREIERQITDLQNKINYLKNKEFLNRQSFEKLKSELSESEIKRKKLGNEYNHVKSMIFDTKSCICSLCGQEFISEKKEELKNNFESTKTIRMEELIKIGNELVAREKALRKDIEEHESCNYSKEIEDLENKIKKLNNEKEDTLKPVDLSTNKEYQNMSKQIIALQTEIENKDIENLRRDLKSIYESKNRELKEVEFEIGKSDCSIAEERKEDLENQLKEIGQKVASIESVLFVLEQFTKEKLNKVSKNINDMFKFVNFKLFSEQINGGVSECCEATINGVPFSSANNGARICAGMDIIKTISNHLCAYGPLFIDNIESVNTYNLPKMDTQLILLRVTEDKTLNVGV